MAPAAAIRHTDPEAPLPEKSSVIPIEIAKIESQRVRAVHDAWERWRGSRLMPARNDIALRDLGNAAVNISLVKVSPDRSDYEFRVIGDAHIQAYGLNFQGRKMSEAIAMAPRFGKILKASYDMICAMRRPYAFRGLIGRDIPELRFVWFETCYFPFGPSPDEVDHVMNVAVYQPRGGRWD
ncbi:MAG TPA: hypothetical protein VG867_07115 [Rhizomicrobium sp.]|nr:hypothetical protein [Rhizomicrobium sp.]